LREISNSLGLEKKKLTSALGNRLKAMVRDGQLIQNKKLKYLIDRRSELICGSILAHRDGYAFVRPELGGSDIYLGQKEARAVFHGDKVLVKITGQDRKSRPSGILVEVLERRSTEFIGQYFEDKTAAYVKVKEPRIRRKIVLKNKLSDAVNGTLVNVAIVTQPTKTSDPIGEVNEILGDDMSPRIEVDIAIRTHQLPYEWPESVLKEVDNIARKIGKAEFTDRCDLRDLAFVTIDGADAKDFDDAVFVENIAENKKLYVAIADVSHYVLPESSIDNEARNRGTSVYFPDRVIPMLPEELSNGICSLVPEEDRLVLVCELIVTPFGKIISSEFYSGIICSNARLIYEDVQDWLDGDKFALGTASLAVKNNLVGLHQVYDSLKKAKDKRGALEIDTVEPKFTLSSKGEIESIEASVRVDAHKIIEECMIAANNVAAKFLLEKNSDSLFRVHD
jgi:ribonuclease R